MKHTTLFNIVATALVLVGVSACSSGDSDDEPTNPTPTQPAESTRIPLTVEVEEQPVIDAAAAREGMTRTDITYLQNLTQFSMDFYKDYDIKGHYAFNKNNNQWTTGANDQAWPQDNAGVIYPFCFYAYTSTGSANPFQGGDNPYISVTVDENAFKQKDVLVAKSATFSEPNEGPVRLTFHHICAAVGFTIKKKSSLDNINLKVTSIVLHNVYNAGDYYYSKGWDNVQTDNSKHNYYTITHSDNMDITTDRQDLTDNAGHPFYLFMIPQAQQANGTEGPYLEVNCIKGENGTAKTVTLPFGIAWSAGYRYYIDIELQ